MKNNRSSQFEAIHWDAAEPISQKLAYESIIGVNVFDSRDFYDLPISQKTLYSVLTSSTSHQSAINFKINQLAKDYIPNTILKRSDFMKFAKDFLIFGNAYLEKTYSITGKLLKLTPLLSMHMRRAKKGHYYLLTKDGKEKIAANRIIHILDPDPMQEIYGIPQYLSALNAIWLNEAATLFRRRYYINGAHAGYIFYFSDENLEDDDYEAFKAELKKTGGANQFKNLLLRAPGGKKDGLQLIPISEVMAKDEFVNIKKTTNDDIMIVHQVPPQAIAAIPSNTSGFGDADKAIRNYYETVQLPLQSMFDEVNEQCGQEIIKFGERYTDQEK